MFFTAWSRWEYSHAYFTHCQELFSLVYCLPSRSIHLHFRFFPHPRPTWLRLLLTVLCPDLWIQLFCFWFADSVLNWSKKQASKQTTTTKTRRRKKEEEEKRTEVTLRGRPDVNIQEQTPTPYPLLLLLLPPPPPTPHDWLGMKLTRIKLEFWNYDKDYAWTVPLLWRLRQGLSLNCDIIMTQIKHELCRYYDKE